MKPKKTYEIFKFNVQGKPGQAAFITPSYLLVTMDSTDGLFRVHDIESGRQIFGLEAFGSANSLITYFQYAISGMGGGQILLWDIENRILQSQIGDHGPYVEVSALDIADQVPSLISGDTNGNIRYWDLRSGETNSIGKHKNMVDCVAVTPDGTVAASGSWDGTIGIWDCINSKRIKSINIGYRTLGLDFSKDGSFLFNTSIFNTSIKVEKRNLYTGEILWSYNEYGENYYYCSCSPEDSFILCGGPNILSLLDSNTGKKIISFEGQTGLVIGMGFSTDYQQVFSAGSDGTVRIWRLSL